jgi:hypothetical protein
LVVKLLLVGVALLVTMWPATARAALVGDGERYAAWSEAGIVHVIDDLGSSQTFTAPPGCDLAAIGGGRVLFDCPRPAPYYVRGIWRDLRTGQEGALPNWNISAALTPADSPYLHYSAIGRRWAQLSASWYHAAITAYVPVRQGRVRVAPYSPPPRQVPDLDDARLEQQVCRPVRLRIGDDPGLGTTWSATQRAGLVVLEDPELTVRVWHCGSREPLLTCTTCAGWTLGRPGFAWASGGVASVVRARGRVTARWSSPVVSVALTGRNLVARLRDGRVVSRRLTG